MLHVPKQLFLHVPEHPVHDEHPLQPVEHAPLHDVQLPVHDVQPEQLLVQVPPQPEHP